MKKLILLAVCIVFLAVPAHAKQGRKSSSEGPSGGSTGITKELLPNDWLKVEIQGPERERIREFYQEEYHQKKQKGKKKSLPPGLKKKAARGKALPPGWQTKLSRGEVLDERVYRQCEPLPVELSRRLPPPPRGTITVRVEGKVIRLMEATREILDVFDVPY